MDLTALKLVNEGWCSHLVINKPCSSALYMYGKYVNASSRKNYLKNPFTWWVTGAQDWWFTNRSINTYLIDPKTIKPIIYP